MRLNSYSDPGHGWVAVPIPLLDKLGILDQISTYSYMRGMLAHLEEDCDLSTFMHAASVAGLKITFKHHNSRYNRSRIRNYCHFNASVARRWMEEAQLSRQLAR